MEKIYEYCSWCFDKTWHKLRDEKRFGRNVYVCTSCENYTVKCRLCSNMAKGEEYWLKKSPRKNLISKLKNDRVHNLCAEHEGKITTFQTLNIKLEDIADFHILLMRNKTDVYNIAQKVLFYSSSILIAAPFTFIASPAIASAIGATRLLGTASTGTAIHTLKGIALAKASLAAIGGGTIASGGTGVAGGTAVITTIGAALGAKPGGLIFQNYWGAVKDFDVIKLEDGEKPALIFINGFLNQKNKDAGDWMEAVSGHFQKSAKYLMTWESKTLEKLGEVLGGASLKSSLTFFAKTQLKRVAQTTMPVSAMSALSKIIANPWHSAQFKARIAGIMLAELIARCEGQKFILIGHSLGARVITHALLALSTKKEKFVTSAHLLGGAENANDAETWQKASAAVEGKVYNYFSQNDNVLRYLYKTANAFACEPIGLRGINQHVRNVEDIDTSDKVENHNQYKKYLPQFFPND